MLPQKMGISPADLMHTLAAPSEAPAFADYIPHVSAAVSAGTRRVYGTYWNRVLQAWGPRPITSVTPLEISQLAEQVKANVVQRKNARGGRGAAEHLIAALRCMYRHATSASPSPKPTPATKTTAAEAEPWPPTSAQASQK